MKTEEEKPVDIQPENVEPPVEDWKDKYLRALAEQDNIRKRMQREKQEMAKFGIENSISDFLPAIDNFENALRFADSATGDVKNWAMGFQMILSQFKEVLHNQGVVSYHSVGNTFDPQFHEAVEIVETLEQPDGMIIQEYSKGYKSSNRTIRPARVKVAKHPKPVASEELKKEETV